MPRYKVDYYYLATGMEGRADERSYGIIEAESGEAAKDIVASSKYPCSIAEGTRASKMFFRGCLSANIERRIIMTKSEICFKNIVINHFRSFRRTNWSKDEVVEVIKNLWIDYLEENLTKRRGK